MPITKSAKKTMRADVRKRGFNTRRKVVMRGVIKDIKKLVGAKKLEEARNLLPSAYKAIDKAVKGNTIKKNTGSRKKSQLAKMTKA